MHPKRKTTHQRASGPPLQRHGQPRRPATVTVTAVLGLCMIVATLGLAGPLACGPAQPVLSGIPAQPLLGGDEPEASDQPEDGSGTGTTDPRSYTTPAGVLLDMRYLGGASYSASRDVISQQLGSLVAVVDLPGEGGQLLTFPQATLKVEDDKIYMLSLTLPEPMRRSQALEALGFSPYVGRYVTLHREYRLNNTWGFRRIRMMRASTDSELVRSIEAWHSVPGQPGPQR